MLVSADSSAADEDGDGLAWRVGDGLAVGDGLIVTDRVTVDGLGAAVIVWVAVVSALIGDRDGFLVADGVRVDS